MFFIPSALFFLEADSFVFLLGGICRRLVEFVGITAITADEFIGFIIDRIAAVEAAVKDNEIVDKIAEVNNVILGILRKTGNLFIQSVVHKRDEAGARRVIVVNHLSEVVLYRSDKLDNRPQEAGKILHFQGAENAVRREIVLAWRNNLAEDELEPAEVEVPFHQPGNVTGIRFTDRILELGEIEVPLINECYAAFIAIFTKTLVIIIAQPD